MISQRDVDEGDECVAMKVTNTWMDVLCRMIGD